MKKKSFFILGMLFIQALTIAQTVTLNFEADYQCYYVPIDSLTIENLSQGGTKTLYYPDLSLTFTSTQTEDRNKTESGMLVSQNYPNPFSGNTSIDVFLPVSDKLSLQVYDLSGRRITMLETTLPGGMHRFDFYACNKQTYLLTVNSSKFVEQQLMIQLGSGGSTAYISYMGSKSIAQEPLLKSITADFPFSLGDELLFRAYITNQAGEVVWQEITDSPESDFTYFFDIANDAPEIVSDILGENQVLQYQEDIQYWLENVDDIAHHWADFHWALPEGWLLVEGQGSRQIVVNAGAASGEITVNAENNCGQGPAKSVFVDILYSLSSQAVPEAGGTLTGEGYYVEGEQVPISASPAPFYQFTHWDSSDGGVIDYAESPSTLFTMPDQNVNLTAHFELNADAFENTFDFVVETTENQTEYSFLLDGANDLYVIWKDDEIEVFNGNEQPSFDFGMAGEWTIRVAGEASRLAFYTGTDCIYAQMLRDILSPISEGVSGINSTFEMFRNTQVIAFSEMNFLDEVVSEILDMSLMFHNSSFNQSLSQWDVSQVTNMSGMFALSNFNQDISAWNVANVQNLTSFLEQSELSAVNYDNVLVEWAKLTLQNDVIFDAGYSQYHTGAPADSRAQIIEDFNWTIIDGGMMGFNLELESDPEGVADFEGAGRFAEGQEVPIHAIAHPFYEFVAWSEPEAGHIHDLNSAETLFTMPDQHIELTAHFELFLEQEDVFTFVVNTTEEQTDFMFVVDEAMDLFVLWDENNLDVYNGDNNPSFDFGEAGQWIIKLKGSASRISFFTTGDLPQACPYAPMLVDILTPVSHGITGLNSAYRMFRNTMVASFTAQNFFDEVSGDIVNMSHMFLYAAFNQDISGWDVSSVNDMRGMFSNSNFNQPLWNWDVRNVTHMNGMFSYSSFNQDIGGWDVSGVTHMTSMFDSSPFNQDIGDWDVGNVTSMWRMFAESPFDQDIGGWDVSKVGSFGGFLEDAALSVENYNSLLTQWSELTLEPDLTFDAGSSQYDGGDVEARRQSIIDGYVWTIIDGGIKTYNLEINTNPKGAATIEGAGSYAKEEEIPIKVTANLLYQFIEWNTPPAGVISDLSAEETIFNMPNENVTLTASFEEVQMDEDYFYFLIQTTEQQTDYKFIADDAVDLLVVWNEDNSEVFNGSVQPAFDFGEAGEWIIKVQGQASRIAFYTASNCPYAEMLSGITPLAHGVSGITSTQNMFRGTKVGEFWHNEFLDDISGNITNMSGMFSGTPFNNDIGHWDVSNVSDMSNMFTSSSFNQDIGFWDVSSVTDMSRMFFNAPFNKEIGNWNVSKVVDMLFLFAGSPFNRDISGWDVGQVTSMRAMFYNSDFNQDISGWDVSQVTNMGRLFHGSAFNQNIGNWDVSEVTNMAVMFMDTPFNQDIGSWDVGSVTHMGNMFQNTPFNQDISQWDVSGVTDLTGFLEGTALDTEYYNELLYNWSNLELKQYVTLHAGESKYDLGVPAERRQLIMDEFGWNIIDGGDTGQDYPLINVEIVSDPHAGGYTTGSGNYQTGDIIEIAANPRPFYQFAGWETNAGEFDDASLPYTTFTVPNENVFITANFIEHPGQENTFDFVVETTEEQTEYKFLLENAVNFGVLWEGDSIVWYHGDVEPTHDFGEAGIWTIKVRGQARRLSFFTSLSEVVYPGMLRDVLTPVSEGITGITSATDMFYHTTAESFTCAHFFDEASAGVTSMYRMFQSSSFNQDISNWDVSNVLLMERMFRLSQFNQDIGNWDVSNVWNMDYMFASSPFNQDIGNWDVSGVSRMRRMLSSTPFNQDISQWDVSNVSLFEGFLGQSELSVQHYNNLLVAWSQLELQENVVFSAGYSQYDLGEPAGSRQYIIDEFGWTIHDGGQAQYQLIFEDFPEGAGTFIGEGIHIEGDVVSINAIPNPFFQFVQWEIPDAGIISDPDVAETTFTMPGEDVTLTAVFEQADTEEEFFSFSIKTTQEHTDFKFVVDGAVELLVVWDEDNSQTYNGDALPHHDFHEAGEYFIKVQGEASRIAFYTGFVDEQHYSKMLTGLTPAHNGITGIASTRQMFAYTEINSFWRQDLFDEVSFVQITDMSAMFKHSDFNRDIGHWDVGNVTNMEAMFLGSDFNQDIGNWNVGNVTNMEAMFLGSDFNQDIGSWNVSNVTTMGGFNAGMFMSTPFNQDIGSWIVSNVTDMSYMFSSSQFNHNIGGWDVSNVTDMRNMFSGSPFNQDIGGWDVSSVINMGSMFSGTPFNNDIGHWDVSNVSDMLHMFTNSSFNQDIGFWDVSNVTNMAGMFAEASSFNLDIGSWVVDNVTDMRGMFKNSEFNQDIGDWDVGKVTNMREMFMNTPFDQDIGSWDVSNVNDFSGFLSGSTLSPDHYSNLLIQWSYLDLATHRSFNAGNSKYHLGLPQERRQYIQQTFTWHISDGGDSGEEYTGISLALVAEPLEAGSAKGGGTYQEGDVVEISAIPGIFYQFSHWEAETGELEDANSAQTTFTMPGEHVVVTANFIENPDQENTFRFVIETTEEQTQYSFRFEQAVDLYVYWQEGHIEKYNGYEAPTHDFGEAGTWTIKVQGQASWFFFNTIYFWPHECPYAPMLRDILTPVSDGITGLTSARRMFMNTEVESFTSTDFFDITSGHIENMERMFAGSQFNQDIGNWDVSNVTTMNNMFANTPFNQDISNWNVGKVTNIIRMFASTPFNQPIADWDVSSVEQMDGMFINSSFNQGIDSWDVSNVTSITEMFRGSAFNRGIGSWDVSGVTAMTNMFNGSDFNQDIGGWDVSNVRFMRSMFENTPFDQDISSWDVFAAEDLSLFLSESALSNENYNNLLVAWSGLPLQSDVNFHAGDSKFDAGLPAESRQHIIDTYNWTITDGGQAQYTLSFASVPEAGGAFTGEGNYLEGEEISVAAIATPFFDFLSWDTPEAGLLADETLAETTFTMPAQDVVLTAGFQRKELDENYFLIAIETTQEQTEYRFVADDAVELEVIWTDEHSDNYNGDVQPTFDFEEAGQWIIKVQGQASRIAFYTGSFNHPYMAMLKDVTPLSDGVTGITSATRMFERTQVERFSSPDFFDQVSENITDMYRMFAFSSFNQDISGWNVSHVTNMESMFRSSSFNQPLDSWQVDKVQNMQQMFYMSEFNQDISLWNVDNVENMRGMFAYTPFNQDIGGWYVNKVTNMAIMFKETPFNHDIGGWNVSAVTDMEGMFYNTPFNHDIGAWDVSQVTNMSGMFYGSEFDQDIGGWNVGNVTVMGRYVESDFTEWGNKGMFEQSEFNRDIGNWDVSQVTNMRGMFYETPFNQDIGQWNTGNVTTMRHMFLGSPFNQDIGQWDVSNVTNMNNMFRNSPFDQDIGKWDVSNVTDFTRFLMGGGLSTENYNSLLIQWSYLDLHHSPIHSFHAGSSQYDNGLPFERRQHILTAFNWSILDGGSTGEEFGEVYVHLVAEPEGAGSLAGSGIYQAGQEIEISATANPFYTFDGWEATEGVIENDQAAQTTFTVPNEQVSVTANFNETPDATSSFDFVVETTAENTSFTMVIGDAVDFFVYWREGHIERFEGSRSITHDFEEPGEWTVKMAGEASQISFFYSIFQRSLLKDILTNVSDGITGINSTAEMFRNTDVINLTKADFLNDFSGNITDMRAMFQSSLFNQDISHWDVSNVTNMQAMFRGSEFNQDIRNWDVSSVEDMSQMFYAANAFDQDIGSWDVSGVNNISNFLTQGPMSTENYNQLLIGWSFLNLTPGLFFDAGDSQYDLGFPQTRRQYIIDEFGWHITDGGDTGELFPLINLALIVNPQGTGTVEGAGSYEQTAEVEISATAHVGYDFINWSGDTEHLGDPGSATTTVTIPDDHISLTANFSVIKVAGDGVTDIDDNVYPSFIIGDQEWMAENLRVTKFNDGTAIPTDLDDTQWSETTQGAFTIFDHTHEEADGIDSAEEMVDHYGKLYNWYAVSDERGLCPAGWTVPTHDQWEQLKNYITDHYHFHNDWESDDPAGTGNALKSCRQVGSPLEGECATVAHPRWDAHDTHFGTDDFGFSALPAGIRQTGGSYQQFGFYTAWWSATPWAEFSARFHSLIHQASSLNESSFGRTGGFSVRCVKEGGELN